MELSSYSHGITWKEARPASLSPVPLLGSLFRTLRNTVLTWLKIKPLEGNEHSRWSRGGTTPGAKRFQGEEMEEGGGRQGGATGQVLSWHMARVLQGPLL